MNKKVFAGLIFLLGIIIFYGNFSSKITKEEVSKKTDINIPEKNSKTEIFKNQSKENNISKNDDTLNKEKYTSPEELPYAFIPDFKYRQGDLIPIEIKRANMQDKRKYQLKSKIGKVEKSLDIYSDNGKLISLLPISSNTAPGIYKIEVYENNNLLNSSIFRIQKREFEVQNLEINKTFEELKTPKNMKSDEETLKKSKSASSKTALFEDKFIYPLDDYYVSTSFQAIRFVNNTNIIYRHSGIDMASPKGTKIKSSNSGIVTYSAETISGGNTVIIDHGLGIFTQYMHLDKIYVNQNQIIKQGEEIGEVGSTGFSTGAHLHFDACKDNVYIDPEQLIKYNILENLKE